MTTAARERSQLHLVLGALALVLLALLGVAALGLWHGGQPAVVRAARTFTLASLEPGRYQCSLRDNREAGASTLVWQRVLEFERSDLVELELASQLQGGARVAAGQIVATLRSLHGSRLSDQLRAERDALAARRALLEAGGLPAEIAAASSRVEVAAAELAAARTELARGRALARQGLISDLELETLERDEEICRVEVQRRQAEVGVAEHSARPEELAALDAEISAVAAHITELERLAEKQLVRSPIAGLVRLGQDGHELQILEVDPLYVSAAVPADEHGRYSPGSPILFASGESRELGEVVTVSERPILYGGRSVVWVNARLQNQSADLRPGECGTVVPERTFASPSLLAELFPSRSTAP